MLIWLPYEVSLGLFLLILFHIASKYRNKPEGFNLSRAWILSGSGKIDESDLGTHVQAAASSLTMKLGPLFQPQAPHPRSTKRRCRQRKSHRISPVISNLKVLALDTWALNIHHKIRWKGQAKRIRFEWSKVTMLTIFSSEAGKTELILSSANWLKSPPRCPNDLTEAPNNGIYIIAAGSIWPKPLPFN